MLQQESRKEISQKRWWSKGKQFNVNSSEAKYNFELKTACLYWNVLWLSYLNLKKIIDLNFLLITLLFKKRTQYKEDIEVLSLVTNLITFFIAQCSFYFIKLKNVFEDFFCAYSFIKFRRIGVFNFSKNRFLFYVVYRKRSTVCQNIYRYFRKIISKRVFKRQCMFILKLCKQKNTAYLCNICKRKLWWWHS